MTICGFRNSYLNEKSIQIKSEYQNPKSETNSNIKKYQFEITWF